VRIKESTGRLELPGFMSQVNLYGEQQNIVSPCHVLPRATVFTCFAGIKQSRDHGEIEAIVAHTSQQLLLLNLFMVEYR